MAAHPLQGAVQICASASDMNAVLKCLCDNMYDTIYKDFRKTTNDIFITTLQNYNLQVQHYI